MEELLTLYLLERPRSVSDMIRELTEKELPDDAGERREQIPRIAGNWFREDTGYLWRLQEQGVIQDRGRQYAIDKDWLVDRLLTALNVYAAFPDRGERGGQAPLSPQAAELIGDWRLGDFRDRVRGKVLSGRVMAQVFDWDVWGPVVTVPDEDGRTVRLYRPLFDVVSAVHLMLLAAVLGARRRVLTERMQAEQDAYFRWKNRRDRLDAVHDAVVDRVVAQCFPWAERRADGTYVDDRVAAVAETVRGTGGSLPRETQACLADLYLLSFQDSADLVRQRARHDGDVHMFFNLLERGWFVTSEKVDTDPSTGNYRVPLEAMRAYLDDLARRVQVADGVELP